MSSAESSETLGTIEWTITEGPTWETIYSGRRGLKRGDIEVIPLMSTHARRQGRAATPWTPAWALTKLFDYSLKQLYLEGGFFMELPARVGGTEGDPVGFGLRAGRTTSESFSWEWFNIVDKDRAKKLQEGGELRIRLVKGRQGWEVEYTEFLTDVSLRIQPRDRQAGCLLGLMAPPPKPIWRINILKGSTVHWPLVG